MIFCNSFIVALLSVDEFVVRVKQCFCDFDFILCYSECFDLVQS